MVKRGGKIRAWHDGVAGAFVMIMLDGIGDRSYAALGHCTPLQAAHTPNMDRLAALGANGLFHADLVGLALPSENAHFAMFGYDRRQFPGRGYLEALGAGLPLKKKDVALLAHFVSVRERDGIIELVADRPPVSAEEAEALTGAIAAYKTAGLVFSYRQTKGLDGIVTISGQVSPAITDSDPIAEGVPVLEVLPCAVGPGTASAGRTAAAVRQYLLWCCETLADHPVNRQRLRAGRPAVNFLVTQRAGRWRPVANFEEQWGLKALTVASGLVYWGLGKFIGFDVHKARDSDDPGRDLAERLRIAVERTDSYQFIHVHSKAPDAAAHTKDPAGKVRAIEALDRGLVEVVEMVECGTDIVFALAADHSTPSCGVMVHSGEPVPLTLVGPGVRRDLIRVFDEVHCAGGALGFVRGPELMPMVLNHLDRGKLQGLMDTPVNQPYWPGRRQPFRVG